MKVLYLLGLLLGLQAGDHACAVGQDSGDRPNIVLMLADDMGWRDPQCYQRGSKIPTPNLDRLADEGMRFTDAHTPSSVCLPLATRC
jgi:arylsulfatase A-like enzyme